jgi:hypothetical protein
MLKETFQKLLLEKAYEESKLGLYDFAEAISSEDADVLKECRNWAYPLIKDKLLSYVDEEKTIVQITNYGKFWMVNGGYIAYLRDEHDVKEKRNLEREKHQEKLLEARLKLTNYRLLGFWIALVVSALGFTLSIINLFLYMSSK